MEPRGWTSDRRAEAERVIGRLRQRGQFTIAEVNEEMTAAGYSPLANNELNGIVCRLAKNGPRYPA